MESSELQQFPKYQIKAWSTKRKLFAKHFIFVWDIWKTDISNIFGSIGRSRKCDEECVWESICIYYLYLFMRK